MSYAPAIEALERELATVEARAASLREAIAVLGGAGVGTLHPPVSNRPDSGSKAETPSADSDLRDDLGTADVVDQRTCAESQTDPACLSSAPTAGLYGEDGRDVSVERPAPALDPSRDTDERGRYIPIADRILAAIRQEGPDVSNPRLCSVVGCAQGGLSKQLATLEAQGKIRREGGPRNRRLIVSGDTPAPEAPPPRASRPDAPRRRFADHGALEPEKVHGLAADHPAFVEGRTLFPSTVVDVRASPRVLISGANQRKLGDRVTKGPWAGMAIYALTLEERATCPTTCAVWSTCYGNGMPMARRHRHGAELERQIETELRMLDLKHKDGFVVRLHVLGDFYSAAYVEQWARWLQGFPRLHVFGYTAWPAETDIGSAVALLRAKEPDRFAIRTSVSAAKILVRNPKLDGQPLATTIRRVAEGKQPEGIVCPAQTHDDVCCGSCGLCWSPEMRDTPIAFMLHGRRSEAPAPGGAQVDGDLNRSAKPAPPKPTAAQPAGPKKGPNRAPIPYTPPKGDDARAQEQAEIERFLAEKGARRFDDRAGLLGMLEAAFAAEGLEIKEAFDVQARRQHKPYRLAGKLVTAEHAIRHADIIRKRMGLPPIAAEVTEAAE